MEDLWRRGDVVVMGGEPGGESFERRRFSALFCSSVESAVVRLSRMSREEEQLVGESTKPL